MRAWGRVLLLCVALCPVMQLSGCTLFEGDFAERVLLGTLFDSVQQTAYGTFFDLGAELTG